MKKIVPVLFAGAILFSACERDRNVANTSTNNKNNSIDTTTTTESDTTAATSSFYGQNAAQDSVLTKAVSFKGAQVTGVTITQGGRMFANFPRWHDSIPFSVVEVMPDGTYKPYPDASWNTWNGKPLENHYTCVQSVVAHGNSLYVLDPASPKFAGVLGQATLYEFDLSNNQLKNKWSFDKTVAPTKSYLNDLRVDEAKGKIYMTDSGLGALVVLDLKSGKAKRKLANHPSVKSENIWLSIGGKRWEMKGSKPQIHSDGIALSPDGNYLYYHALTGYTLYRIPTFALADDKLTDAALAAKVETLGKTPAPDGMIFDKAGNLYMADLEKNSVIYRNPAGQLKTLVKDANLKWADTFTIGADGTLYFTDSRLHEATGDISGMDFPIYKIKTVSK